MPASVPTGAFSISTWVNISQINDFNSIIAQWNFNPEAIKSYKLSIASGGEAAFSVTNDGSTDYNVYGPETVITTDKWYHLTAVFKPNEALEMYIDGDLKKSEPISFPSVYQSNYNTFIGNAQVLHAGQETFFNGSISNLVVYDKALTSSEIRALYNQNLPKAFSSLPSSITSSAVLAYEMSSNDASLTDLSGNGNDGTAHGGVMAAGSEIDYDESISVDSAIF